MRRETRAETDPKRNRLLSSLTPETLKRLTPHWTVVDIGFKDIIVEMNETMRAIYFPLHCIFSMLVVMEDGLAVEVATIGHEGMVGIPAVFGVGVMPCRIIAQGAGKAIHFDKRVFERELLQNEDLAVVMQKFTQALFVFSIQSTACNRLHSVQERCARWLLHTQDRCESKDFNLTQEFLAQMLGVRRPSVTVVAALLQNSGAIQYARGRISVTDRPLLESLACECYRTITREYDRIFPPPSPG